MQDMTEEATILLVTVIATVVGTVLALEAWAWLPHLSQRLLRKMINRLPEELPEDLASRWSEEIEADFETYQGRRIGGLVFAVGLWVNGGRKLLDQLTADADEGPDPAALEVDQVIPALRLAPPVAEPPAAVAAVAALDEHPLIGMLRRNPKAIVAISFGFSLCLVALEIFLEERER